MSQVIEITSIEDTRVKDYQDVRDVDLRGGGGFAKWGESNKLFMAESEPVIRRMLEADRSIKSMFFSKDRFESMRDVLERLPDSVDVFVADDSLLKDISGYRHHRGALSVGIRSNTGDKTLNSLVSQLNDSSHTALIVCEGITKADNIGAIFRNAAAFGVAGVLLDKGCTDPLFRKAIRVSMGHVFNVPWKESSDWPGDLLRLKHEYGFTLVAAESVEGAVCLSSLTSHEKIAFLFGSEKTGLSKGVLGICDEIRMITMAEGVPSINVAATSAVFLYQWSKLSMPT